MIRINLLTQERGAAKKKAFSFNLAGQKMTILASVILLLTVVLIGWRYYSLTRESDAIDTEIRTAQQETARLHSVIQQVQQFEQRRAQLQQRVVLIEELRKGQSGPVHMLDQVSRALPPMLWLTELRQNDKNPGEVLIDGRCTTLTGLSDFVTNLEATGYFKKSIEIVSTTAEAARPPVGELIRFSIRGQFLPPAAAKASGK
jgi:type IV pilus assembly protein PilN